MELLSMVVILHALCLAQGGLYPPSLSQTCSGTLGTRRNGSWEAVSLDQLSMNKKKKDLAEQICKHQDCGRLYKYNKTGSVTSLINCFGNSSKINCTEAEPAVSRQATEIVCEHQVVRLAAGRDVCAGRVELLHGGVWGTVCDDEWNFRAGDVVCAQLDCGTALRVMGEAGDFVPGKGPIHISKLNCTGAERNLWECRTQNHTDSNYCGHKEDAGVMCSGSAMVAVTVSNTTEPHLTNWTTAFVSELMVEESSSRLSAPVWGCIVLSLALLLVLLSNAALFKHYKGRHACVIHQLDHDSQTREDGDINNLQVVTAHAVPAQTPQYGESEARRRSLHNDSETSSDSNYYFDPQMPAHSDLHVLDNAPVVGECHQAQGVICKDEKPLKNTISSDVLDSESTSSGECYENTEAEQEKLFSPDVNQLYGEQSVPMGHLSNTSPSINPDVLDSGSTSSGECYENTEAGQEKLFNPDVNQFYREQSLPMGHLSNSTLAKINYDASDSDSTSSDECYENTGMEAEAFVQTLDRSQSRPEQNPPNHHISQPEGFLHKPNSLNQDNSSTSSGEDYENVPGLVEENCQSSSSSDYDDVTNW